MDIKKKIISKKAIITTAVIATAILIVAYLLLSRTSRPVEPEPVVQVETVESDDVEIYGEYVGSVRAAQFVEVRARVEGYLEKMLFKEGSHVSKGQVLFVINPARSEERRVGKECRL